MKPYSLLFSMIAALALVTGCKKDNGPADNIVYQPINDTLSGIQTVTLNNFGCPTRFSIYRNANTPPDDTLSVMMTVNPDLLVGCGGPNFLYSNQGLMALDRNALINDQGSWDGQENGFQGFIGQGEKFLAYRSHPDEPEVSYSYGWIRIRVSAHCDTLFIFDCAQNYTYNNNIKAGQKN
jgi:hypothetical protein